MINKKLIKDVYSTNELKTDKVWIDGKPIYRKVINIGIINTTGSDVFFDTGIKSSDISQVIKIEGTLNINIGSLPVNFHNHSNTQYSFLTYVNYQLTNARVSIKNNYPITGGKVIIEYTKN